MVLQFIFQLDFNIKEIIEGISIPQSQLECFVGVDMNVIVGNFQIINNGVGSAFFCKVYSCIEKFRAVPNESVLFMLKVVSESNSNFSPNWAYEKLKFLNLTGPV